MQNKLGLSCQLIAVCSSTGMTVLVGVRSGANIPVQVLPSVTKVVLGCEGVMANGCVLAELKRPINSENPNRESGQIF